METVEYARGRLVDLFGDPAQQTVLLWHGSQTDARTAVRPLAELMAVQGGGVVVPDWNSHADDGGRGDLLRSVHLTRRLAKQSDRLVLVGWSLGGVAAAGLTMHAQQHGVQLGHTVCLAGAFMARDPICGGHVAVEPSGGGDRSPFTLLHGAADNVIPIGVSRSFRLDPRTQRVVRRVGGARRRPWGKRRHRLRRRADCYSAAEDAATLSVATDVARRIAAVIGSDPVS